MDINEELCHAEIYYTEQPDEEGNEYIIDAEIVIKDGKLKNFRFKVSPNELF